MRDSRKSFRPAVAMTMLALTGCASESAPIAATQPVASIAVSCDSDTMTDQPCVALARQKCPGAAVDTIRLVLAKQVPVDAQPVPKTIYQYQATYHCPAQRVATTP